MRATILRLVAAGMLLVAALIHYDLWADGYRRIPSVGPLFLVSTVGSLVVILGLLLSGRSVVLLAGVAAATAAIAALVASRTVGFLGFEESWTEDAVRVLAAELGAIVALAGAAASRTALRATGPPP